MHTKNPFNGFPPAMCVDRVLGRSYDVVKSVYMSLPLLRSIDESPELQTVVDNMSTIQMVGQYWDSLKYIHENMDFVETLPTYLDTVKAQTVESVKQITDAGKNANASFTQLYEASTEAYEGLVETSKSDYNTLVSTSTKNFNTLYNTKYSEIDTLGSDYTTRLTAFKSSAITEVNSVLSSGTDSLNSLIQNSSKTLNSIVTNGVSSLQSETSKGVAELTAKSDTFLKEVNQQFGNAQAQISSAEEHALATVNNASSKGLTDINSAEENALANILEAEKHGKDALKLKGEEISKSLVELQTQCLTDFSAYAENQKNQAKKELDQKITDSEAVFNERVEAVKAEAEQAMFSFRYISGHVGANATTDKTSVYPVTNLKVGDHVVDQDGCIYAVTGLTDTTVTVGSLVTSIQGLQGPQGDALKIQGIFDTASNLAATYPVGNKGDVYIVQEDGHIYVWDDLKSIWADGGIIKGDRGQSANEILMSPDPEQYFKYIYGQSTGDIIGDIVVNPNVSLDIDPSERFLAALGSAT